jgi:integrase
VAKGRLTQAYCEREAQKKPKGGERVIFDGNEDGFVLCVGRGSARFKLRVEKMASGKRAITVHNLGRLGQVTADEARKEARRINAKPDKIVNPRKGPTLLDAWESYKADLKTEGKAQGTIANYEMSFDKIPELHKKTLRELSDNPKYVKDAFARITAAGTPVAANAMVRFVRATYRHAQGETRGLPSDLPTSGVQVLNPEVPRDTALSVAQLPEWNDARNKIKNPIMRELPLFLLLTGLRRASACTLRWDDVDPARRAIRIKKPKSGKPFWLPLSKPIEDCLARLRAARDTWHAGSPWVFPSPTTDSHIVEIKTPKLGKLTGHALRRSYSVLAQSSGVPFAVVKQLLDHTTGGDVTAKHYSPGDAMLSFLGDMQERASAFIMSGLGG